MSQISTLERLSAGSKLDWITGRPTPIDFGGPVDVPFESTGLVSMMDGIERQALLRPDKLAVEDGEKALTYAELVDRMRGLRRRILNIVPPGGVVAAVVHNSAAATVAMSAAVSSGRIFVPIDAGHPVERQSALFAESGAHAVLLAKGVELDTRYIGPEVHRLEFDVDEVTGAEPGDPAKGDPTRPGMVMFTSGSTGRPKGLAFGVGDSEQLRRYVEKFHLNADDVFISLASLSQTGAADLIGLTVGATVRIVDVKRRGMMEALRVMGEDGVTFLSFVPSVLRTLMALPGVDQAMRSLRILDLHGESILASDIALFRSKLPAQCCISITYGSTEAGAVFSWFVRDEAITGAVAPIGYLASGKSVALIDETGQPVRAGEVGELLVRGRMALGSWMKGQLSDARFMKDPDDPRSRIYGMGDLVRQREDGLFEYVGRRDRQIKIRGLWADLGEIETALRSSEGVADAAVVVRKRAGEADTLAAFVAMIEPHARPDKAQLRRNVVSATAEHMAPSEIRTLEAIPRLANYKPDLRRLSALLDDCGD